MTTLVPLWIGGTGVDATASAVTFNNGVIVDDINLDGKVITITGSPSDTFTITSGTHGATTLATTDAAGTDGNLTLDADGVINLDAGNAYGSVWLFHNGTQYASLNTTSNNFNIKNPISDGDIIFQGNDGGSAINALTLDMSNNGAAIFRHHVTVGDNLALASDSTVIYFGNSYEITLTHVHNSGLSLKHTATGDDNPIIFTLQTGETDIAINDVIGAINFQAPDESTGTDAILVAAGIEAVSEGDFSATNNATKLSFKTAASEVATEKMSLSSVGLLTIADSFVIKDAGNIGSASDTDAIAISSGGVVTFSQAPVFPDGSINIADLDIDGGTDIGEAIVDADLFIIDNGAGGTNRKTAASRLKTYISAGTTVALDDITTGDAAATLATSAGNITIDAQGNDTDIIFKGTDGGADTTFLTLDGSAAGAAAFNGSITAPSQEYTNSLMTSFSQVYNGAASSGRFVNGDYQKVITITPSGASQNYTIYGRISANNGGGFHTVNFVATLRSNTLPDLAWNIYYDEDFSGTRYFNPLLWTKETTTAGFILAFQTLADIYGNVDVNIDVITRDAASKANLVMNTVVASDQAGVDTGFTSNAMTLVTSANGTGVTFGNVKLDGKVITMTGSTGDTAVFTAGTNGTLSIVTTDAGGAAANIQITADGTAELAGTTVTLDSSTTIEINADNATTFFKDGSTAIAAVAGTPQAPGVIQNAGFVPVGSILAHGSATVPTGWLDATGGAAVSRSTYSVLFAVLGTLYGTGDGTTTFNLPSLGDRVVMGKGTNNSTIGASSTAASASFVVATASGSASLTVATASVAQSAKDSSVVTVATGVTSGGHTHNLTMPAQVCMYIIKA